MGFWKDVSSGLSSGLTGGFGGLISSGLGSLFGQKGPSQEDLMKWQEKMLDKQLNYQRIEAEKNRSFQSSEARVARDWNAIGSQLARADAAGVNPYALVNNGSYGSAGAAVAPSGSMPSGSGTVPQPAPNTSLQRAQSFSAVADAMARLAEARRTGVDTTYMERSMNDLVRKAREDADNAELVNNYQRIVNNWQDRLSKKQYSKLNHEIDVLISTDWKNLKDLDEANARINKLNSEFKLTSAQWEELRRYLDVWFDKEKQSIIDLNVAKANQASQGALLNTALANKAGHESDYIDSMKKLNDLAYDYQSANNEQAKKTAAEALKQQAVQFGLVTEQMRTALETAIKNKDWFVYDKIMSGISAIAGAYGNVMGGRAAITNAGTNIARLRMGRHSQRSRTKTRDGGYIEDYDEWFSP